MPIDGLQAAVSGLKINQRRVEQTAHDLANLSTPGYQPRRVEQAEMAQGGVAETGSTQLPGGPPVPTDRPLDLALAGGGFFAVDDGQGGSLYTRAGNFSLDATGNLVDAVGRQVRPGIQTPEGTTAVHVTAQGQVQALDARGEVLAQQQIETAVFGNPGGLQAVGGNSYRATNASGPPVYAAPGVPGHGEVISGALAGSGTDLATSMVNLIMDQRAFEANTASVRTQNEMLGTILDINS